MRLYAFKKFLEECQKNPFSLDTWNNSIKKQSVRPNIFPQRHCSHQIHSWSANFREICSKGFPGTSADFIKIKVNADVKNLKPDEDGYAGMEEIIYHVIRCGLVNDCAIDQSVRFIDSTIIGNWEKGLFFLPKSIIIGLMDAVKNSLEYK